MWKIHMNLKQSMLLMLVFAKSEKIDLAILFDDKVKMLIECKSANIKLSYNHLTQLFRYFAVSNVKIAILTNGIIYKFFTDSQSPGRMDETPFRSGFKKSDGSKR